MIGHIEIRQERNGMFTIERIQSGYERGVTDRATDRGILNPFGYVTKSGGFYADSVADHVADMITQDEQIERSDRELSAEQLAQRVGQNVKSAIEG